MIRVLLTYSFVVFLISSCRENVATTNTNQQMINPFENLCDYTSQFVHKDYSIINPIRTPKNGKYQRSDFDLLCDQVTVFLDEEKIDISQFREKLASDCIAYAFDNGIEQIKSTGGIDISPVERSEFRFSVSAYTEDYFKENIFNPNYFELHVGDFDMLYLNLNSVIRGTMTAYIFNTETNEHITAFDEKDFKGSYNVGHNIADKSLGNVTAVLKVGNSFAYKEFSLEPFKSNS